MTSDKNIALIVKQPKTPITNASFNITEYARHYLKLSDESAAFFEKNCFTCRFKKGEVICRASQTMPYIFIVVQGVLRGYIIENRKDITIWFAKQQHIVLSPLSFFSMLPSEENIQCLEEAEIIGLHYKPMAEFYQGYPEGNAVGRRIMQHLFELERARSSIARHSLAKTRYQAFMQQMPDLVHRISNKYIASYLNMSLETFSRLKSGETSNN